MLMKYLWPLQQDTEGSLRGLVRQLSIDQFENEGRRVDPESSAKHQKPPLFERTSMDPGSVHKVEASTYRLRICKHILCCFLVIRSTVEGWIDCEAYRVMNWA